MRGAVCIVSPGNLASNPRVLKEADGTQISEYAIQLRKTSRGVDLADALHAKSAVIDAEIK